MDPEVSPTGPAVHTGSGPQKHHFSDFSAWTCGPVAKVPFPSAGTKPLLPITERVH